MSEILGRLIAFIILYVGLGLISFIGLYAVVAILDWSFPLTALGLAFVKAVTFVILFLAFVSGFAQGDPEDE